MKPADTDSIGTIVETMLAGNGDERERMGYRPFKRVGFTQFKDGARVSTVQLPIDHGFGGKPLWFETMVFPSPADSTDLDCERYETEEEALKGHEEMVKKWSEGREVDPDVKPPEQRRKERGE